MRENTKKFHKKQKPFEMGGFGKVAPAKKELEFQDYKLVDAEIEIFHTNEDLQAYKGLIITNEIEEAKKFLLRKIKVKLLENDIDMREVEIKEFGNLDTSHTIVGKIHKQTLIIEGYVPCNLQKRT